MGPAKPATNIPLLGELGTRIYGNTLETSIPPRSGLPLLDMIDSCDLNL